MASFEQAKYCPNCKRNVSATKDDRCKICGGKIERRLWSVRFRIMEYDGEKQKRLSGFKTKKEAQQAFVDYTANHKIVKPTKHIIFDDVLSLYLKDCKTNNASSTVYDKEHIFLRFITPYFSKRSIESITKADLVEWQNYIWNLKNKKTNKTYAWEYLSKIRITFQTFLEYCENIYDIPNRFKTIKIPKNKELKKEINFWDIDTFNKFISSVDDILWNTMWATFMYTGARFNEIRALADNDIVDNQITINKSLEGKKSSAPEIKATKNYKIVHKKIPDILASKIIEYKKWKQNNNISNKFLFGGDIPLSENTIRRQLRKDINNANVSSITPHGFRHSYVSLLIHLGINTKVIAELIGDREEQVIETYGHLYPQAKEDAINLLNSVV